MKVRRGWKDAYRRKSTIGGVLDQAALAKLFALTPEDAQRRRQDWDTHGRDPLRPAVPRLPRLRFELPTAASSMEALRRHPLEDDAEQPEALDEPEGAG